MYGWMGEILEVDLSSQRAKASRVNEATLREFLGGRGLGTKILFKGIKPGADPLGPENLLVFAAGPLTGTLAPTSGRYLVVTKSPLTGMVLCSSAGGRWGAELRFAGYDAVVVKGKAEEPIYLWVHDGEVEFKDARHLWGKGTRATTQELLENLKRASVACVGPAGERLVKFACIINDECHAAGRGGAGAVMGSKKLKAIVVQGTRSPKLAHEENFRAEVKRCQRLLKRCPLTGEALLEQGTAYVVDLAVEQGAVAGKNFRLRAQAERLGARELAKLVVERRGCFACPIPCHRVAEVRGERGGGPQGGTLLALGAGCGLDLEAVALVGFRCNDLGLDTISTGGVVSCALELAERGLLEGPSFGEPREILKLVEQVARGEGLGRKLAEGSARLAEELGAPECSMSVKQMELPSYDPGGSRTLGLAYVTSNRGGCHLQAYPLAQELWSRGMGKLALGVEALIEGQNLSAAVDSLVLCRFSQLAWGAEEYTELLNAATGLGFSGEELLRAGERVFNLERLFNLREGFGREQDTLPPRLLDQARFKQGLDEYYELRGWSPEGVPERWKLKELGLA